MVKKKQRHTTNEKPNMYSYIFNKNNKYFNPYPDEGDLYYGLKHWLFLLNISK